MQTKIVSAVFCPMIDKFLKKKVKGEQCLRMPVGLGIGSVEDIMLLAALSLIKMIKQAIYCTLLKTVCPLHMNCTLWGML